MTHANLSRRALVVSAAALPAIAVLPTAVAANPAANQDAELLKLGIKLDRLGEEWLAQCAKDAAHQAIYDAAVEKATGVAWADAPKITAENREEGYWATRMTVHVESDDPDPTVWGDIHDRLYPVIDQALAHKATTPAGLAVQTQAIALQFSELWDDERDTDGERTLQRLFVESVSSCLGIVLVPMQAALAREAVQS